MLPRSFAGESQCPIELFPTTFENAKPLPVGLAFFILLSMAKILHARSLGTRGRTSTTSAKLAAQSAIDALYCLPSQPPLVTLCTTSLTTTQPRISSSVIQTIPHRIKIVLTNMYRCRICHQNGQIQDARTKGNLMAHLGSVHSMGPFRCALCPYAKCRAYVTCPECLHVSILTPATQRSRPGPYHQGEAHAQRPPRARYRAIQPEDEQRSAH